jgi:hypothetical protein
VIATNVTKGISLKFKGIGKVPGVFAQVRVITILSVPEDDRLWRHTSLLKNYSVLSVKQTILGKSH